MESLVDIKNIYVSKSIVLRQIEEADAEDIFKTIDSQRKYLGKWLPFVNSTQSIEDSRNFILYTINRPKEYYEYVYTIRFNNEFAGLIGFKDTDRINKKTEIGYWLSEKFQKKGIMTESVNALTLMAFNEMGLNRVQIKCAVDNTPSMSIPKRLKFQFEGIERNGELLSNGCYTDLVVFSKLKYD